MPPKPNPFPLLAHKPVLIVLTSFDLGGAERQALHLASFLQDICKAQVAVVALFGGLGDQPVRQMCVQRRLPCLRVNMPEHTNGMPTFRTIRQFARDIAFLQPDILLPYTTLPNVLSSLVWRIVGAKACFWNQRDEGREVTAGKWHALALKNATGFISNSRDGLEFLASQRGVQREKIDLIFNGVELPKPRQSPAEVRAALNVSASSFLAVMLANIHQYKDHATLLLAWKIVCERAMELDPILLLAGREDDGGEARRLVASLGLEGRVRLMGPVADVSSLLHAADLSVFSSWREGTPNAVLESMAAGRAVVATAVAGCRDVLGGGYAGLIERENPAATAEKIVELARNEILRNKLGSSLKQRAADEFSVSRMCERTCQTMLDLGHD